MRRPGLLQPFEAGVGVAQRTPLAYADLPVTMRVGLIGTGWWSTTVHAPSLAAHPNIDFVGVWGRDQARTAELSGACGARAYADPDRLIDDVDALSFAVPPAVQADLATRAARRGRHVLLEKPIATSLADARRLEDAVAATGGASIVFFTHRFVASTQDWLERLRRRGGWTCAHVDITFSSPSLETRSPWRHEHGALWDLGPHVLSLLVPLLGDVTAIVADRGHGDQVHLIMQHSAGRSSTASVTLTAPAAIGTHVSVDGEAGREVLPPPSLETPVMVAAHQAALDALLGLADRPDRNHACDVHFGARVVEVLDAARRSLADGCRIDLAN
jgi:predicted dehydrogenase